jgi:beta-lactamase regulating signal transducer with metallopeptidase domain/protocatechuate 3,4-dioxygenase beta subunit
MNLFASLFDDSAVTLWGWVLVHFLWQGAFVALIGWIALSLGARCTAQVRYLIATGCLLVAAVCPVATACFLTQSEETQPPIVSASLDESTAVVMTQQPVSDTIADDIGVIEDEPASETLTQPRPINDSPPTEVLSWYDRLESALPWIVTGWFLGVIVLTIRLFGGWWLASREIANGKPLRADWMATVERLSGKLRIRRAVRWVESVRIDVPQVIGWWKPVVLVPVSILSSLTPREIECLLIHELAHIRRFDFAVNLMQCAIETILFFHPGVWWLSRRIRLERELACDETTLRVTGDQLTFSRALLSLADLAQLPQPTLAATEGDLTKRVHAILGTRRAGSSHVGAVLLSLIACVTVAGVIFWRGPQETPPESETVSEAETVAAIERFASEGMPVPELSGRILDANGAPVADAVVYLRQSGRASESRGGPTIWEDLARTTSESDGQYRFTDVFDSETGRVAPLYDVVAFKKNDTLGWKHVRPKPEGATVNVTLKQSEPIVGRVTDESGNGVPNAKILLKHLMSIRHITQADLEEGRWPSWSDSNFVSLHGFREAPTARTDEDGHFELSGVIENSGAILEIAHPDYLLETAFAASVAELDPETAAKTKRNVQTGEIKVSLKHGYRVELMVVDDESGEPIPNVRYAETHKSYRLPPEPRTDTGTISIPHLESPKFRAIIYPPENSEYLGFGQYFEWPAEQYVRKVEVRLKKGIAVTGRVVSADNAQPVAEVPVYVSRIDKNSEKETSISPHPFVTDPQGRFTAIVPPGEYKFSPRGRIRGFLDGREKQAVRKVVKNTPDGEIFEIEYVDVDGIVSQVIKVTSEGATAQPLLELTPAPRFRLIVTDPAGTPAPDIKISTRAHSSLNSYMSINVTTDERGEYLLDQLFMSGAQMSGPGRRGERPEYLLDQPFMSDAPIQGILGEEVVFRSRDNELGAQLILERPNEDAPLEQTIEVKLKKLGTVVGRTVDEAGQPVAGTSIWLYKQDYQQNGSSAVGEFTTTDADGRFELKGVLPGIEHSLSLSHTRYRVPNSIHTHFTLGDSNDYEFGDIQLSSLTPPDVPELAQVTAPDVSDLSPEEAYKKLASSYTSAYETFRKEFNELKEQYSREHIVVRLEPTSVYCQEFMKLARRDLKSEIALKSCLWIVNARRIAGSEKMSRELLAEAAKNIAANFLGRPEMAQCIYVGIESFMKDRHRYSPDFNQRFVAATEQLMQYNSHRDVHARACFFLSELLMAELLGRGPNPEPLPRRKRSNNAENTCRGSKTNFPSMNISSMEHTAKPPNGCCTTSITCSSVRHLPTWKGQM